MTKDESRSTARDPIETTVQKALRLGKRVLPLSIAGWLDTSASGPPAIGRLRFGDLARTSPIDGEFGFGRGTPIDRFYIESFLERNRNNIAGRVLEIGSAVYSQRFGAERVTRQDVLDVRPGNPQATIVGDISAADILPRDSFDCIVLTQTLQYIYDLRAAVAELHAALKPGGVLLVTLPGISQIESHHSDGIRYWAFTPASASRLFAEAFGAGSLSVESHGNVFAAVTFLHGVALEEVPASKLLVPDADYPMIVTLRAERRPQG
jgi:SAM-dependent methyltransferase